MPPKSAPSVGQRIDAYHRYPGVVRHVGPLVGTAKSDELVGVELDRPRGSNDGSVNGVRYFQCSPNHGLFLPSGSVHPHDPKAAAAATIQDSFRQRRAVQRATQKKEYQAWNRLDVGAEHRFMQQTAAARSIDNLLARQAGKRRVGPSPAVLEKILQGPVEPSYSGPHLPTPLTSEAVMALLQHMKRSPQVVLHPKYALQLILDFKSLLAERSVALDDLELTADETITVVGDTHGQLADVLWIFHDNGYPSAGRRYVFNGDIADRGSRAVEIFLVLFAFKLLCPRSVYITRGNHENAEMNERDQQWGGGFKREVCRKYGVVFFNLFQDVFNLLPLAFLVNQKALIVHGGIPRKAGVRLEHLRQIDHRRPCPASAGVYQDSLFIDLLWADPRDRNGCGPSERGPNCIKFGPDVSDRFIKDNNLQFIVRSHEVPSSLRGWDEHHNGRVITVFSASNYCGTTGNFGGVLELRLGKEPGQLQWKAREFWAPPLADLLAEEAMFAAADEQWRRTLQRAASAQGTAQERMRADLLQKVRQRIVEKKDELLWYFQSSDKQKDPHKKGRVTEQVWRDAMAAVLELELPWKDYLKDLAIVERNGSIDYQRFLRRYRLAFTPEPAAPQSPRSPSPRSPGTPTAAPQRLAAVYDALARQPWSLAETLRRFGANSSEAVPEARLAAALTEAVPPEVVTQADVAAVLQVLRELGLPSHGAALIEAYAAHLEPAADTDVTALRHALAQRSSSADEGFADVFERFDVDGDGFLSYDEFIAVAHELGSKLPPPNIALADDRLFAVARALDAANTGRLTFLQFCRALCSKELLEAREAAEQRVYTRLYEHRLALRRCLRGFDSRGDGTVTAEEMQAALLTLNAVLGQSGEPLSPEQVAAVIASAPRNAEGRVVYDEFLDGFSIVDTGDADADLDAAAVPAQQIALPSLFPGAPVPARATA